MENPDNLLTMMPDHNLKFNKVRKCMVPECTNNSLETPNKIFKCTPRNKELRKQWIEAVRLNTKWTITTTKYCCQDHFEIPGDLANLRPFLNNYQKPYMKLKPGVVPHRFDCCKLKKNTSGSQPKVMLLGKEDAEYQFLNSNIFYVVEQEETEIGENRDNMVSNLDPTHSNENRSELGFQITEVHSVTKELENFINFEIDANDVVEKSNLSDDGDFLQESDDVLIETKVDHSEENPKEDNAHDKHNEISDKEMREDSDDDTFEEEIFDLKKTEETIEIPSSDDENINDKNPKAGSDKNDNSKDNIGIHFMFLNDKSTEDCLLMDNFNDSEKINQETAPYKAKTMVAKDDPDCIVISEGENSSDMENMAGRDITVETPLFHMPESKEKENAAIADEEITEMFILERFEIVDKEGDVLERLKDPKKIVVVRTNSVYTCPLNCTFLATDRASIIEHLISHERKRRLQEKKAFCCPLCPYRNSDKEVFVDHIVYHKEPCFACNYCNYVGTKLSGLKVHMYESHEVNLSCDNCHGRYQTNELGKYFAHQWRCVTGLSRQSKRRRESESGDEFRCHFDPCPFTANSQEALKTHEWIQHQLASNNIKRFKCYIDYCNVETFRQDVFEAHIDAHPGFQLQCKQCPHRTLDWESFKDHVIDHVKSSDQ